MHVHMHTFEPVHMLMTSRIFQVTYFTVYAPILTPLAGVAWHASIGFPKDTSNYEVAMVISGCVVIMLYTAIWICLMWVTKAYICHGLAMAGPMDTHKNQRIHVKVNGNMFNSADTHK